MKKGDKVIIRPKAYPGQEWRGVILRAAKWGGFSVQYEAWGVRNKQVFGPSELEVVA